MSHYINECYILSTLDLRKINPSLMIFKLNGEVGDFVQGRVCLHFLGKRRSQVDYGSLATFLIECFQAIFLENQTDKAIN